MQLTMWFSCARDYGIHKGASCTLEGLSQKNWADCSFTPRRIDIKIYVKSMQVSKALSCGQVWHSQMPQKIAIQSYTFPSCDLNIKKARPHSPQYQSVFRRRGNHYTAREF